MSRYKNLIIGVVIIVLAIGTLLSLFPVDERKQAIVLQFGQPKRVIAEPGLAFKLPWQDAQFYEKRVLNLDPPAENILLSDQKRLIVDVFARYKITDPLRFFQSVRTEGVARQRLGGIINGRLREVLGNETLTAVLSDERTRILQSIRDNVDRETQSFGIALVDVRIRRADLPDETRESVFDRMRSEREREAAEFRAQGQELSQQIRARADRERTVLLAEAERTSEILRGEGDEEAIRLRGEAFSQDAEFYSFYRALEAYRGSFNPDDTTLVLSPNSAFFRYFNEGPPASSNR